jgi:hypothetical protein
MERWCGLWERVNVGRIVQRAAGLRVVAADVYSVAGSESFPRALIL